MPRRRLKSKRKARELTNSQFWNLMLNRSVLLDKFRPAWESAFERKRAWFELRDQIMAEWFEDGHFGRRPGAWWAYECPDLPRLPGEEDFEYLIRAGEVKPEERGKILANFVYLLEINRARLQSDLKYSPAEFDESCEEYERQAQLLGEVALKKWEQVLARAMTTDEPEEKGGDGEEEDDYED
ncbi:MAG: hypothetical protein ACYC0Q_05945 [Eubacteriales bacterium]